MALAFDGESTIGLKCEFGFKCQCGWEVKFRSDSDQESLPINDAMAWASRNTPISHQDLSTLLTPLDIPPPSLYTFKQHKEILERFESTTQQTMRLAT